MRKVVLSLTVLGPVLLFSPAGQAQGGPIDAAQPAFALAAGPQSSGIVARGGSASYRIDVKPPGDVRFSFAGLPRGVTASWKPASSPLSRTLTLTASRTAAPGSASVVVTGVRGSATGKTTVALMITSGNAGDPYVWPAYHPDLDYNFRRDYPAVKPPTRYLPDLDEASIKDSYASGWWCFRSGKNANSLVTSRAWIPLINRLNNDFAYLRDVMGLPPDKRAKNGYYSAVYLFGSGLRLANGRPLDRASNTDKGGWMGSVRYKGEDWPNILASYYPVYSFDPTCPYPDKDYQMPAMVHEGIHAVLADMPGGKKAAWLHEAGNTTFQSNMTAQLTGDYSAMGWLGATSMLAPFQPIECYSGWLQDGSFGGPSAEGVDQGNAPDGQRYATWRRLFGGVQYSEAFPHFLCEIVSPGALAWVWQNCTNRVLEGLALAPGGLGDAQARRLIMEYRARSAFCDFGRWSAAYQKLLTDNWNAALRPEGAPLWIEAAPWTATCYQKTTNDNGELTPDPATTPGWSGANFIPLTVTGKGTVSVLFKPLGNRLIVSGTSGKPIANTGSNEIFRGHSTTPNANPTVPSNNMTCQLVYRAEDGRVVYGQPVSGGVCRLRLDKPVRNNVVVAVICNTDYLYQGESSRLTKFDYRLTLGSGVVGAADVNKKWFETLHAPALTAVGGDGEAALVWGPVAGARSYTLRRAARSGGPYTEVGRTVATSFTDTGLRNGATYYYVATTTGDAGVSIPAIEVRARTFVPAVRVPDSGFETPITADVAFPPGGSAWTFTARTDAGGSGVSANNSAYTSKNQTAPQGRQVAVLDKVATLSRRIFGFKPGTVYTLRFLASQRQSATQHGNTFDVRVDGKTIGSYFPNQLGTGYTEYSVPFKATAATHTISFVGTNRNGGDNAVFLDRVLIGSPGAARSAPARAGRFPS